MTIPSVIMLSVLYDENCKVCPLGRVSLCGVSSCWMSLFWACFRQASLCWVSIMLSIKNVHYAVCYYAECHYAECHYAEGCYSEHNHIQCFCLCWPLSNMSIKLSVVMLNVIMLNAVTSLRGRLTNLLKSQLFIYFSFVNFSTIHYLLQLANIKFNM